MSTCKSSVGSTRKAFNVPRDFLAALQAGWNIVTESTRLSRNARHRHGRVVLEKGQRRIRFEYTATGKIGFEFSKPELL